MGDLPESRVCPSSVFQRTGIDFAGPFLIRSSKGRGSRNTKCYICVFVCLATKAVHLEVVSDLTSKAFIACLKRFVARRVNHQRSSAIKEPISMELAEILERSSAS
ncbi:uncharacterized protein TNCV_159311 [Trichonephila clavipes]|uniref:Uncharacterized protein n=1 Tax=Trichonephila clavipes TaxID=2585209 RepID=A0A8X6RAC0_TRICX|nr:uncharacterized protein TNCV_159311 [Trichonephila clavipes]